MRISCAVQGPPLTVNIKAEAQRARALKTTARSHQNEKERNTVIRQFKVSSRYMWPGIGGGLGEEWEMVGNGARGLGDGGRGLIDGLERVGRGWERVGRGWERVGRGPQEESSGAFEETRLK